jgi:hypothetical protein
VDATSPAGAVVSYTPATATDVVSTPTIVCTGNASTKSVPVLVQAAATQITNLMNTVHTFNLQQGITHSLDAKLANAEAALTGAKGGAVPSTCGMLNAFINQTQAQLGNQITVDQASQLLTSANRIKAVIGCP